MGDEAAAFCKHDFGRRIFTAPAKQLATLAFCTLQATQNDDRFETCPVIFWTIVPLNQLILL
jgi:hypothetical protein